jgi:hypothetical protein
LLAFIAPAVQPKGRPSPRNRVLDFKAGPGTIRFCFSPDLAKRLGWKAGDRVGVLIGDGVDTGKVAFFKKRDGLLAHKNGRQLAINVSASHIDRQPPFDSTVLKHESMQDRPDHVTVDISRLPRAE